MAFRSRLVSTSSRLGRRMERLFDPTLGLRTGRTAALPCAHDLPGRVVFPFVILTSSSLRYLSSGRAATPAATRVVSNRTTSSAEVGRQRDLACFDRASAPGSGTPRSGALLCLARHRWRSAVRSGKSGRERGSAEYPALRRSALSSHLSDVSTPRVEGDVRECAVD